MDSHTLAQPRIILRCQQCGHEWKGRRSVGTARQCSKCRSRSILQVTEEDTALPDTAIVSETPPVAKTYSPSRAGEEFNGYLDDPEVHAKIRELQIARLERQIAEEQIQLRDPQPFNRLVGSYKYLLRSLWERKALSNDAYRILISECPWCGESTMHTDEDGSCWTCDKCGRSST
jgi:ribosomal protein L37AE/L43A